MDRTLLRIEEVADRTGIPIATLRFWRSRGEGGPASFKLGRRVVFDAADVNAWIEAQRRQGGARPARPEMPTAPGGHRPPTPSPARSYLPAARRIARDHARPLPRCGAR